MGTMLLIKVTRSFALNKLEIWSGKKAVLYFVSSDLQKIVAKVTGGKICEHCEWCIAPGDHHPYCENELNGWQEDWSIELV